MSTPYRRFLLAGAGLVVTLSLAACVGGAPTYGGGDGSADRVTSAPAAGARPASAGQPDDPPADPPADPGTIDLNNPGPYHDEPFSQ